jgi:RimJ/RimL family protein N-acetyltransferase
VESHRLVVRAWETADADELDEAIAESSAELARWLPWALSPQAEPRTELLGRFRRAFDSGHDFSYGLFSHGGVCLGGAGLHPRVGPDAFEIGYWIRTSRAGQGLATETAAVLTRVGLERCGAARMVIKVEPENAPSLRVARKLGYRELGLFPAHLDPLVPGGERRDAIVFELGAEELPGSPCAAVTYA